ncbi:DUF4160 domain-containing protein [Alkalicaulis satelles]|uniref:DUF4160 domain-containing protein n=1 Tax=Alkalicaulis satelles TaxID=2609175 RepID=UPI001E5881E7|nr:DUF4160 domain-containing protein [Alkalicaulis satelles]
MDRDDLSAKFWLTPVSLARNAGFGTRELTRLHRLISQHQADCLERWHDFFGR